MNETIEVLLVDNHRVERELIGEILRNMGCRVTLGTNDQECVSLFNRKKYDLIIFDHNTVESNFNNFVTKLAEIAPLTPTAMMVTIDPELYVEKYGELNIDFLVSKPFGYRELQNLVREALALSYKLKESNPTSN